VTMGSPGRSKPRPPEYSGRGAHVRDYRQHEEMIPVADDLYDEHLDELREEGPIP
jgi:hypothetical protein